jgi:DNA-binding NarL/FixJ family response regulator
MSYRVLLIQNNLADTAVVCRALRCAGTHKFCVGWARTLDAALLRLQAARCAVEPDHTDVAAILVDLSLLDRSGLQAFDRLLRAARRTPILVMGSDRNESTARSAVRRGAQDYLLKDRIDSEVLPQSIASMIERTARSGAHATCAGLS